MKILLFDNYDSFTYNLLHILKEFGADTEVFRNDRITLDEVARFDKIILSPGPGIPQEAGILLPLIERYAAEKSILGVCLVQTALGQEAKALFPRMVVRLVLDAGHGGWDPGKTGTGGENEKILNLAVTEKLTEYLGQGGAEVILTRNQDTALGGSKHADMAERQRIANEQGADNLHSLHQNAIPSAMPKRAQVLYHKTSERGKILEECVQ